MAEKIELEIGANLTGLDKGLDKAKDDIEGFAERTKSSRTFILSVNISSLQKKIEEATQLLKAAKAKGDFTAEITIGADIAVLKQNLTQAKRELTNFLRTGQEDVSVLGKLFSGVGSAIKGIGAGLIGGFGLAALGAGLKQAGEEAFKFNEQINAIGITTRATSGEIATLTKEIRATAIDTGISADQIATAALSIAQAGVPLEQLQSVLLSTANFAVSSGTSIQTAFDGIFATSQAFGIALSDLTRIQDVFIATNIAGKVSIEGLAANIGQVAPIAASAGVSLEELAAGFATLVGVTGSEAEVATQLRAIITAIAAPADEAKKAYNALGIEFGENAIKAKGLGGVIKEITEKTGGNLEVIKELIPRVEALTAVQQIGGAGADTYAKNIIAVSDSYGLAQEALERYKSSEEFELKQSARRYEDWKLSVGQVLVKFAAQFIDLISLLNRVAKSGIITITSFFAKGFVAIIAAAGVFGKNIAVVFENIPFFIQKALKAGLGVFDDFLNGVARKASELAKLVGGDGFDFNSNLKDLIKLDAGVEKGINDQFESVGDAISKAIAKVKGVEDKAISELLDGPTGGDLASQGVLNDKKKEIQKTTEQIKKELEAQQKAADAKRKLDALKDKGGGSADAKAKKEIDAKIASLNKQADLDVQAVKESILSEKRKAEVIVAIREKLANDILIVQGKAGEVEEKNAKAALANRKKLEEEKQKTFEKATDELETGIGKLAEYAVAIQKVQDKFAELRRNAQEDVREITRSLADSDKEIAANDKDRANSIAERRAAALKELTDTQNQIAKVMAAGATENQANAIGRTTLSAIPEDAVFGTTKASDLLSLLDLMDKRAKLEKEIAFATSQTTEADRKAAEATAARSESEKIAIEADAKKKELIDARNVESEKLAIAKAGSQGRVITAVAEGDAITATYEDERGQIVQITDQKNAEYALQFEAKRLSLENELKLATDNFEAQRLGLIKLDTDRRALEANYTKFFGEQLKLRGDALADYQRKLEAARATIQAASLPTNVQTQSAAQGSAPVSQVNVGGVTVNNNVDAESFLRSFINSRIF